MEGKGTAGSPLHNYCPLKFERFLVFFVFFGRVVGLEVWSGSATTRTDVFGGTSEATRSMPLLS